MRVRSLALVLLGSTLVGCGPTLMGAATGGGSFPARPAGATYSNWEYVCAAVARAHEATDVLNEAGREGWELVAIDSQGLLCFKRPAVTPAAPSSAAVSSAAETAPAATTSGMP